ncbi:MAG: class I SAM-dependent methyltransferase [Candidatus Hydrogenedentota bacterium]
MSSTLRDSNLFDRMAVDVEALYLRYPVPDPGTFPGIAPGKSTLSFWYRLRLVPPGLRERVWRLLVRTRIDETWFEDFQVYWTAILGGRPLWGVEDFHFLRNTYRVRFQESGLPENPTPEQHVAAWQSPELLYFLFQQVYRRSRETKLSLVRDALARLGREPRTILEFGSGVAPITRTCLEFDILPSRPEFFIADIATLAFHYAAFSFRHVSNVRPVLLDPAADFGWRQPAQADVIFCLEVFEHLDRPLETVEQFHRVLAEGGILVFDYVRSEAEGFDTRQGLDQRSRVLEFIARQFHLLQGKIHLDRDTVTCIARKR